MFVIMNVAESLVREAGVTCERIDIGRIVEGKYEGEYVGHLYFNGKCAYQIWSDGHFDKVDI